MIDLLLASLVAMAPAASVSPPAPFRPRQQHQPGDLAPCPGVNPSIRRPRGSNCLGIVPSACGADRARPFLGTSASQTTRAAVMRATGHGRIRWIRPREAVTQDLVRERLNVELDHQGRIQRVECY